MITYKQEPIRIYVYLNGKKVGTIVDADDHGFQYFADACLTGGEVYPTIAAVKASLESE